MPERWERREEKRNTTKRPKSRSRHSQSSYVPYVQATARERLMRDLTDQTHGVTDYSLAGRQLGEPADIREQLAQQAQELEARRPKVQFPGGFTDQDVLRQIRGGR